MMNASAGSTRPGEDEESGAGVPPLDVVALDDDADFREYIRSLLDDEGHAARVADTPEDLFITVAEREPDVVLLDMNMGEDSGIEVLKAIRARWPRLCVIIVTGHPSMETMRATFKESVFDYIQKPFGVEEFRRVLGAAAREYNLGGRPQDRLREELGRQIRLARTQRGWTLKDLSEASAISVSQLSSIERGAHLPSVESLLLIADALEIKPSEWLRDAGF